MWSTTLRGLMARKRRLLATTTAVVLGVAFLVATLAVGDTMRAGFAQGFAQTYAGVDVAVRSTVTVGTEPEVRDVVDPDVVASLARLDDVAAVFPVLEGVGTIVGADGARVGGGGPPTVATNWIADPAINPYRIAEGRAPAAASEVVIDRASADSGNLAVGDTATVLVPEPVAVTVVGIVTFGDQDSFGPSTYVAFDAATADTLLAVRPGAAAEVLVVGVDGVSDEQLRDEVAAALPPEVEALTRSEIVAAHERAVESDFIGLFERMLLVFAGVALLVATFSIYNTFSITAAQRTRESALMRALGASRRQVLTGVTLEALVIGGLAATLGIGLGLGLALGLQQLVAAIGFDLGAGLQVTGGTLLAGALVALLTTLTASFLPALSASRVAPLAALRSVAVDRSATSIVRAVAGAVITAAGLAAVVLGAGRPTGAMTLVGLGALVTIIGAVVLGPVVARPAASVMGGVLAGTRGVTGTLARRNAMRNPRRVASSASALLIGTAVVALFATFASSMKASLDQEVDRAFSGDLVVLQDDFSGATISPDAVPAIAELPEVASVVGVSFVAAEVDGAEFSPIATDPAVLAEAFDLGVVDGDLASMTAGQVAISTDYAGDRDLQVGDTVTVTFVDGDVPLTVAAVYAETLSFGDIVITSADWTPRARGLGDSVLFVNLTDGTSIGDGQAAVAGITERFGAPDPQTRAEYIEATGAAIDAMMGVVYGLLGLAVLIALLGIANTLSLSIHERTRELGLLRAVGQTRRQLRATIRWESVIVAVFGTIGGVGLGTFLGWNMMRALRAQEGLGEFAPPTTVLAVVLVLAGVAGVLAALRPARRAARLDVLSAISTD